MTTLTDSSGRVFHIIEKKALRCTDAATNTNKFWQCALLKHENPTLAEESAKPWAVAISWGRVGTVGQKVEKRFTREHGAKAFMEQRYRDKMRKDYVQADELEPVTKPEPKKVGLSKFVDTEWDLF